MLPTVCPHCGERNAYLLPWSQRIAVGLTAGAVMLVMGLALSVIGLWPALIAAPVVSLALILWPIRRCTNCHRLSFRS